MSLDPIKNELFQKASHLQPEETVLQMRKIEKIIYETTKVTCRVMTMKNNVIKVSVTNSSAASELYLQKHQLLESITKETGLKFKQLSIDIAQNES